MSKILKTASFIIATTFFSASALAQMGAPVVTPTTVGESARQAESSISSQAQQSASESAKSMADDKKSMAEKGKSDAEDKAKENMPKK
ncbi:MAG TPA: hypothetical protein DCS82_13355 [Rhodospirillaceae bacterium]|nr:hypothetical protein [Rhodospirillaceae bacterium]HAA91178.1 hypothetical protein [Rhodospirillaceae bacterium]HAT36695.1 hypothetical protein [Rhodospirillaceae bacterium]